VKLVHLVGFIIKKTVFLLSMLFNFALKYAIRKVKAIHKFLKFRSLFMLMMLIYGVKAYTP